MRFLTSTDNHILLNRGAWWHRFNSQWCCWNFHWQNPSSHTRALWSTQPLTEMCTRNISWGVKAAGVYGWQRYHLHVLIVLRSGTVRDCTELALPIIKNNAVNYGPSWEPTDCSCGEETPHTLWNLKICYNACIGSPLEPVLSYFNAVHTLFV